MTNTGNVMGFPDACRLTCKHTTEVRNTRVTAASTEFVHWTLPEGCVWMLCAEARMNSFYGRLQAFWCLPTDLGGQSHIRQEGG
jgi:hypothetical protein